MIPILWQHDPHDVVGKLKSDGTATFLPRKVTRETMIIGAGWRVLESEEHEGVEYILRAQVLEFSVGEDNPHP